MSRRISTVAAVWLAFAGVCAGQSIQSRIDTGHPGDTVVVSAGTWTEDLTLHRRVALIGAPGAILRGTGAGSVITVTADSCVVEGLTIEHSGGALVHEDAGILLKSDGHRIRRNRLRDVLFGIYLYRSDENHIDENDIMGRPELAEGERGSGVHIWDSYRNRLTGNTIRSARDGFYIQNASQTWIEGNEVSHLRYGLHYMYADSNTFVANRFHDNVAGAAVMYSRGIVMRRNAFVRNRGFASYGILFQDCHDMRADSNVIADNVVGMFFEASTNNVFRHNIVAQNDVALKMFQNSSDNRFTENAFIDNLIPLSVVGRRTMTRWSDDGRGNYWSDYDGYDLDGDGTGDVPHTIQNVFDFLEGRQPAFRLYLYSPASKALAAATKAFPLLQLSEERDAAPLMHPVELSGSEDRVPAAGTAAASGAWAWWLIAAPAGVGAVWLARRRRS